MKKLRLDLDSEKENRRSSSRYLSIPSKTKQNQSFQYPKSITPRSSITSTSTSIPPISRSKFKTQQQIAQQATTYQLQYSEHDFQTIAQILTLAEKMLNKCDKNGSHFNLNLTQYNTKHNKSFDPNSIQWSIDQSTFDSRNQNTTMVIPSSSTNRSGINTISSQQSIANNP